MMSEWRKYVSVLPVSSALVMVACSGTLDDPSLDGSHADSPTNSGAELDADENGVVLGTSWQALSYPTCASAASDPDGDGWGWENNKSCVVNKAAGSAYPACARASSDPDGDGWGWENNKSCVVKAASSTAASSSGSSTNGSSSSGSSSTCSNLEGTSSTMAAIAVAAAMEIGRWQPLHDFTIGKQGGDEILILTAEGKARCDDHVCSNTQALLDFQKNEANGKILFPGNVALSSPALRSRLVAKFREQVACESQPSNGGSSNCPVEEHTLTFQRSEKGGCDTNFFFVARKLDGSPLDYPEQLKNKLLWADRTNRYIGFQSVGEVVSIDPTFGLNERATTTTGACTVACVRIGSPDLNGDCCSCGGVIKTLTRSVWSPSTFICQ